MESFNNEFILRHQNAVDTHVGFDKIVTVLA